MATIPIWVTLITASLGGLLTLAGVMITQRQARLREDARWYRECEREQTRWTREDAARSEERTQQRLADSYLEVLRIVEREGQRVEARITNWKTLAEDPYGEPEPGPPSRGEQEQAQEQMRVRMRESVADQATIAAHLAAFGSPNVRRLYETWRSVITGIEHEEEVLGRDCEEYWPGGRVDTPPGALKPMLAGLEVLQPKEDAARRAMEDAMAAELGHR